MNLSRAELRGSLARVERARKRSPRSFHPLPVIQLGVAVFFATPLIFLLVGAFRPDAESFRYSGSLSLYTFLPEAPTIEAFRQLSEVRHFGRHLLNTVTMGLVLATSSTLLSALAAYPLARMYFRGRNVLFFLMVATVFLPFDTVIPPLFLVIRDLNITNTFWGLFLPWVFSPLAVYLLRQSMQEIPQELEEAAILDGAGLIHILRDIILPNIRPALAAVWIYNFIFVWDWSLWPLVAMQDTDGQLVQPAIMSLFSPYDRNYSLVFAASLVAVAPVIVVFLALQRFFVRTMVFSGGK